jgi:peptidoglycan/xylan/chitin deacetylase (PgdA/CDA1 family)
MARRRVFPRDWRRAVRSTVAAVFPPKPKPLILMYHRVADEAVDPWGLAVSPAHFEQHTDVLRRTRQVVQLSDFVSKLLAGTLPANAAVVTFDDGYVDNLIAAKPRLAKADLPATVFLATGFLDQTDEFWWDELARLILLGAKSTDLKITVRGEIMRFDLKEIDAERERGWRAWHNGPRTARQDAYLSIWSTLRNLGTRERETAMVQIRSALAGHSLQTCSGRPMTSAEVRTLVSDGLIAIGAHTVSHPVLTELPVLAREREIASSKATCSTLTNSEVQTFAYPFGSINAAVRADVAKAGFTCACSTKNGPAVFGSDIYALPRYHVFDVDGDAFERSLRYASAGG